MSAKTQIVDFLGDKALVLPALLDNAIASNEQAKYVLSLLQMAVSYAERPQDATAPSACCGCRPRNAPSSRHTTGFPCGPRHAG
jgi:hypothetical protein